MRRAAAVALACMALAGCDSITGNDDPPSMTGQWRSEFSVDGTMVVMEVTASQDGRDVTGSGTWTVPGAGSLAFSIEGTHVHPDVSFRIFASGMQDANYTGEFDGKDLIRGELNGSGFVDERVNLGRQ